MEERVVPVYAPGETTSFELAFTHKMKITEVYATLTYTGGEETNLPSIFMQQAQGVESSTTTHEGEIRYTKIDMESMQPVLANVVPGGEYRLTATDVRTCL